MSNARLATVVDARAALLLLLLLVA